MAAGLYTDTTFPQEVININNNQNIEEIKAMARRTIEYAQIFRAINLCGARVFTWKRVGDELEPRRLQMSFGMMFIAPASFGKGEMVKDVEMEYIGNEAENIINDLKKRFEAEIDDKYAGMIAGGGNEKKHLLEAQNEKDNLIMFSPDISGATEKRMYQEAKCIKTLGRGCIYATYEEITQLMGQGISGIQGNFFNKLLEYLDSKVTTNSTGEANQKDSSRPKLLNIPFILIMMTTFNAFDDKMRRVLFKELEKGLARRMYILNVPEHERKYIANLDDPFEVGVTHKNPHINRFTKYHGLGDYYINKEAQCEINIYKQECFNNATKSNNEVIKQMLYNSYFKVMQIAAALHIFNEPFNNSVNVRWIKEAIKFEKWYHKHTFDFARQLLDIDTGSEKFIEWLKECESGRLDLKNVRKQAEILMGLKSVNFAKGFESFLELVGLSNPINEYGFYITYESRNCVKYEGQKV